VVEAVAYHHCPSRCADAHFGPLAAVHVANALAKMQPSGAMAAGNELDAPYLTKIGVAHELPAWSDLAQAHVVTEGPQ
jgi:hypothetical protein